LTPCNEVQDNECQKQPVAPPRPATARKKSGIEALAQQSQPGHDPGRQRRNEAGRKPDEALGVQDVAFHYKKRVLTDAGFAAFYLISLALGVLLVSSRGSNILS
jgi:hypothetical protein